jgi:hypothetical protein
MAVKGTQFKIRSESEQLDTKPTRKNIFLLYLDKNIVFAYSETMWNELQNSHISAKFRV